MSLAQITEKIEQDAKTEAESVLTRAKEQAALTDQEAQLEINKLEASAKLRFDRERPEIFRRRDIVAKLDVGKLILGAQRRLIDDVFSEALDKLAALDKDKSLAFCESLLKKATTEGNEVLEIGKDEKYMDAAWLESFNAKQGTKITLSDKRANIRGGFLLRQGRVCINCSWEMLVQNTREKREIDVVKRLFPSVAEE